MQIVTLILCAFTLTVKVLRIGPGPGRRPWAVRVRISLKPEHFWGSVVLAVVSLWCIGSGLYLFALAVAQICE